MVWWWLSVFRTENNPKYGNTDSDKNGIRLNKSKPGTKHDLKYLVVLNQMNFLESWYNNSGPTGHTYINIVEMEDSIFLNVGFVYTFRELIKRLANFVLCTCVNHTHYIVYFFTIYKVHYVVVKSIEHFW